MTEKPTGRLRWRNAIASDTDWYIPAPGGLILQQEWPIKEPIELVKGNRTHFTTQDYFEWRDVEIEKE